MRKGGAMGFRQWGKVRVSLDSIGDMLKGDWGRLCEKTTAPDDLIVVGVIQPGETIGTWCWVVCSSSQFKSVPEGAQIPEIEPFEYTSAQGGGQ